MPDRRIAAAIGAVILALVLQATQYFDNAYQRLILPAVLGYTLLMAVLQRRTGPLAKARTLPEATAFVEEVLPSRITARYGRGLRARMFVRRDPRYGECLFLGPEVLALHETGPEGQRVLRALLEHEVAHIEIGDTETHQVTHIFRSAVLFLLLLTVLGATLRWDGWGWPALVVVQAILFALLLETAIRALLRIREARADLHAAAKSAEIRDSLLALTGRAAGRTARSWLRWHPPPSSRFRTIADGEVVEAPAVPLLFLLAALYGAAFGTVANLYWTVAFHGTSGWTVAFAAIFTGGLLVETVLGVSTSAGPWAALRRGAAATAGLLAGILLVPDVAGLIRDDAYVRYGYPWQMAGLLVVLTAASLASGRRWALFPLALLAEGVFGPRWAPLSVPGWITAALAANAALILVHLRASKKGEPAKTERPAETEEPAESYPVTASMFGLRHTFGMQIGLAFLMYLLGTAVIIAIPKSWWAILTVIVLMHVPIVFFVARDRKLILRVDDSRLTVSRPDGELVFAQPASAIRELQMADWHSEGGNRSRIDVRINFCDGTRIFLTFDKDVTPEALSCYFGEQVEVKHRVRLIPPSY